MTQTLEGLLALLPGEKLAVVGCGGKTALINHLARQHTHQKVLVMPTTKIRPVFGVGVSLCDTLPQCLSHTPHIGMQYLGVLNKATGKLEAPPEAVWPRLVEGYDLVLMEADGSCGLPCKGWLDAEPVVPAFASRTIAVVTTRALGKPAGETTVFRQPQFTALTQVQPGQTIDITALAAMVAAPGGMLKNPAGQLMVAINCVENADAMDEAKKLASAIRLRQPQLANHIIAGSVFNNTWQTF